MGTSGRQFCQAFFNQIVDFSMKSLLVYQRLFCLVALLVHVLKQHFHFESDTNDYITALNFSSMKTIIQLLRHDLLSKSEC